MEGCTLGQVLHGSATTAEAIRRAIQRSQESLRTVAKRHGINPKTVAKWRKRSFVADLSTGPKQPASTVLSIEEEATVVAFRRHTLLPLDDCLYALQATIPHLNPIIVASLPEAARHLAPPAGQGRGCRQAKIQSLPDRLFPHRHRRAAHSRGKTLPVRRDRSDLEIRLRHLVREGGPSDRRAFPGSLDRGSAIPAAYGADR